MILIIESVLSPLPCLTLPSSSLVLSHSRAFHLLMDQSEHANLSHPSIPDTKEAQARDRRAKLSEFAYSYHGL